MNEIATTENGKGPAPGGPIPTSVSVEDLSDRDQTGIILHSAYPSYTAYDGLIQDVSSLSNHDISHLHRAFSNARMTKYLQIAGNDTRLAIRLHAWNAAVAASLLPTLHLAEVAIRNFAMRRLAVKYNKGGVRWYEHQTVERRLRGSKLGAQLKDAIDLERRSGRNGDLSDYITNELTFGFWVNVFTKAFRPDLWTIRIQTISASFPSDKSIDDLHDGVEFLRTFRNNVAHHKNVVCKPVAGNYERTLEVLSWVSKPTADFARATSNFYPLWACCPVPRDHLTR